tara:strand:+ start:481 stop:882 length:402 start_codon:yes stop_codon:yes gene_type:complete
MVHNIDLDYIVSKNTLSYIEKTLLEYKKKILRDLAENIPISYKELEEEFLIRPPTQKKYHGKDRTIIDENKCMARVWHKTLGPVQCSRKKCITENSDSHDNDCTEYCKTHLKKLNYGRIDEPINEQIDEPIDE